MLPIDYDLPLAYKGYNYGPIVLRPKDSDGNYLNLYGYDVNVYVKNKKNCRTILTWSSQENSIEIRDLIAESLWAGAELVLKEVDSSKMQMPCGSYSYEITISNGDCILTYYKGSLTVSKYKITVTECEPINTSVPEPTPPPGMTPTPRPTSTPRPTRTPTPVPGPSPTPTPTLAATPTPTPTALPLPFYILYAAISKDGAPEDFVYHTYSSTAFRYDSGSGTQTESFSAYFARRVALLDRITPYYYDPFSSENKNIVYDLTWLQKDGQTSTNILAFFAIPATYGSLLEITDDNIIVSVIPEGGRFENAQGYFDYGGVIYKLYQAWNPQTAGTTILTKLSKFIN